MEGLHGRIERATGTIHNRSSAYNSLTLRQKYFADLMRNNNVVVDELAICLAEVQNPKLALSALGMGAHPLVQKMLEEKAHAWHPMYREILYHSDQYSLFRQPPPDIEFLDHMACVVPGPPPVSEASIHDSLWKFAAIEHLVLGFREHQTQIYSCTAPMGCIASLQAVLSQDEQMDYADLSELCVGDVSASGILFPSMYLSVHLFVCLSIYLYIVIYLSIYVSI